MVQLAFLKGKNRGSYGVKGSSSELGAWGYFNNFPPLLH